MKSSSIILIGTLLILLSGQGCNQNQTETTQAKSLQNSAQSNCKPIETRKPNARDQKPSFKGQTRACSMKSKTAFKVIVLAKGLENPWAVEPLPGGDFLVTEKPGRMRIISAKGTLGEPFTGLPAIEVGGQGGLLDVALSPDFSTNRTIFWSFTEPRDGGNGTSVARGILSKDRRKLEQVKTIFRAIPAFNNSAHFGSRLTFGPDGMLYVTLGERSSLETRPLAQHMDSHLGKIVRITPNGGAAPGNPFIGQAGALPEIWTVGHRNVQAAAFDAAGRFWTVEMGPQGGDELNLIKKGKNYGWPLVTFGEEYSGSPVPDAVTQKAGYESPVYYWDPVIAPSGAQFYSGNAFPEWKGNLFVGALREQRLVRLKIENNQVTGEEHLLTDRNRRIRDVKQGPDGALYLVTDEYEGELWKIIPRK